MLISIPTAHVMTIKMSKVIQKLKQMQEQVVDLDSMTCHLRPEQSHIDQAVNLHSDAILIELQDLNGNKQKIALNKKDYQRLKAQKIL